MYFIWNAAFSQTASLAGMDRAAMVTYIFVAQGCRIITAYNMEDQFAGYIRRGDIIRDLIVPQTYVWKRLWFTVGWLSTMGSLWGISMAKQLIISFTSGAFIPLSLFPDWLGAVARALSFEAGVHIPTTICMGGLSGTALWSALGVQMFWAVVLVFAADRFFSYSLRKMTIPGG